jgi:hypothetical protein
MRSILLVVGLVAIGGCATYRPGGKEPLPSRADGRENVEIVREKESWLNSPDWISWIYAVTVNGENVHRLDNGERVRFGLEAGTYSLGIRCETGDIISSQWRLRETDAEISDSVELTRFYVGGRWRAGGCFITKAPPGVVDGIERIQIIPMKVRRLDDRKNPNPISLTVNGADFSGIRRFRFGLEAGEHTIGVRCKTWGDQSEPYYDEIRVNIEDGAPLIQLYAGRNSFDSPPCFIGTEK